MTATLQAQTSESATPSATPNAIDFAAASASATLAALQVDPEKGLTPAEVDSRRQTHGYNEVAEQKTHPLRQFLGKFWGVSAWMLEMIMCCRPSSANIPTSRW